MTTPDTTDTAATTLMFSAVPKGYVLLPENVLVRLLSVADEFGFSRWSRSQFYSAGFDRPGDAEGVD